MAPAMEGIRELQSRSSRSAIKSSSYQADPPQKLVSSSISVNSLKSANLSCLQRDFRGMSMTSNHNLAECRSTTKINLPNEIMQITSWHGLLNRDFSVPSRSSIAFDVISRKVYGGSNDETCLGIYCSDRLFSFFIRRI